MRTKDAAGAKEKYRRVVAGISWPTSNKPGWIIVIGESMVPDFSITGSPHTYQELISFHTESIEQLCRKSKASMRDMEAEYSGEIEVFGDTTNPVHSIWMQLNGPDLSPARYHDDAADLYFHSQLVMKTLTSPRTLFLREGSGIEEALINEVQKDQITTSRSKEFPALAALGYALTELELSPYITTRGSHPGVLTQQNGTEWML